MYMPYEKFKEIYAQVTRLCVDIAIRDPQGGLLMTLRNKHGWVGQWHTPGGTVYYRESCVDAVKRIVMEELGVDCRVGEMLGYFECWSEERERGYGYSVSLVYECFPVSYDFKLNDIAKKYEFFTVLPTNTVEEHKAFYPNKLGITVGTSSTGI